MKKIFLILLIISAVFSLTTCNENFDDKLNEDILKAVINNDKELVISLINKGADPQKISDSSFSAVTAAAQYGNIEILKYFCDVVPDSEKKSDLAIASILINYIDFSMSYENDINEISIRFSSEISALEKRIADLENDVPVLYGKLDRKVNSALEKSAVEEFLLKEYEKNNNYKGNDSVLTESENYNKENANGAVESSSGVLRFSDLLGDD